MNRLTIFTLFASVLFGCNPPKKASEENSMIEVTEVVNKITLIKAPASPQYQGATLIKSGVEVVGSDSTSSVDYQFEVSNYELGVQTSDAETRGIANSGKGQHIHFIVNNGPYSAHYMPGVSNQLEDGSYTVLAFLSRSYHESVKEPEAFHIENLNIGDVKPTEADLSAPHLFYSRPKGTYVGVNAEKVMLDFYLLNCDLSTEGYKVNATINGEEFEIDEWVSHYITGLPMGEVTIKLELMDPDGELVDSPFNPEERIVTLAAE